MLAHFTLRDAAFPPAFFYHTLVITISFHNWCHLQTHRLPWWLSVTHWTLCWASISTSVSSTISHLVSVLLSSLAHPIPPMSSVHLTKPEANIRPLSVPAVPRPQSCPLLTSLLWCFISMRCPVTAKWCNRALVWEFSGLCNAFPLCSTP